jgi:S-disulfanyl-L-cysteine oxidoreductase SoxD
MGSMRGRLVSRWSVRAACVWLLALLVTAWAASNPGVRAAQAGKTVWDAIYTEAQAERGKDAYEKDCAFCHLSDLAGQGFAPPLIEDTFKQRWEDGTLNDLYVVIKATMPQDKPDSLTADTYADIVAFLLKSNKYPAGQQELKPDAAEMKGVTFKKGGK